MVTLPPPTWVFAGDVPATDRTALREEMEYVRAYFADRFGVEATGFTVLVASNYEALSPVYRDVVGKDLSSYYHPQAIHSYAWVTSSTTGSAVVILMYGTLSERAGNRLKHHIAHEYFHVLQGQLASGFAQLQDGELTQNREEATPVAFTGISSSIEWTLPEHPDALPRLEEQKRTGCE